MVDAFRKKMTIGHAPVAVFAFKRPVHLARMLASLAENAEAKQTDLVIFCDGSRGPQDKQGVSEVRAVVTGLVGFASVQVVHREENWGLARSIIEGVSSVLRENERVIVLEDDLILSPYFLRYMNDGLSEYENDPSVASIHGYCYPVSKNLPETFFMRGADCWGWATWARAWRYFRHDGRALLMELEQRRLLQEFDAYYPFSQMLKDQIAGRNNSWAVRWHASVFLRDMLTLYPGRSLVHNTGNDGSGTHSGDTEVFMQKITDTSVSVQRSPLLSSEDAKEAFKTFFRLREVRRASWWARSWRWLMRAGR